MGDLSITQQQLPSSDELYKQGKVEIKDLRELKVGEGSTIFYTDKEGSRWGHVRFEEANAYIKTNGEAKFKTASGQVLLSSNATDGNFVNVINNALNTQSKTILDGFTFEETDYKGAFKTGNITWDEITGLVTGGTGIVMNARGLIGANNGTPTFTIDATTGNATFAGILAGASGTFGTITAGSISGVTISGSTITGGIIQTATSGYRMRLNGTNSRLEGLLNNTVLGSVYVNANGDIIIDGTDDANLAVGGTIQCYATQTSFKPLANGTYDLGDSSHYFDEIYVGRVRVNAASPNVGLTQTVQVLDDDGSTRKNLVFKGGFFVDAYND